MTDSQKIQFIRADRKLAKLWKSLPLDMRRFALAEPDVRFIGERLRRLRKMQKRTV